MDGNGRWAKAQGKARHHGHRAGADAVQATIKSAYKQGVQALTLFAFSSENWERPKTEVGLLMQLFIKALDSEVQQLHENNVQLKFVGDLTAFEPRIQKRMAAAEALTSSNTALRVNVAVGYGGQWDISQAARQLAERVVAGDMAVNDITPATLGRALSVADCPEPDLFIRTGGEQRISNFLLWNLAYTELYFSDVLWPDFGEPDLLQAMTWFAQRQRRFGRVLDE